MIKYTILTKYFLGAFFLEYWKRQNAKLAYDWNVLKFESDETDLPEYVKRKALIRKELRKKNNNQFLRFFYSNEKQLKTFISILILLFMVLNLLS